MALMPINAYWITVVEVRWYTLDGTCLPLFITPIFFLFLLCLGNMMLAAYGKARPSTAMPPSALRSRWAYGRDKSRPYLPMHPSALPAPIERGGGNDDDATDGGDAVPPVGRSSSPMTHIPDGGHAVPPALGGSSSPMTHIPDGGDAVPPALGASSSPMTHIPNGGDAVPPALGASSSPMTHIPDGGDAVPPALGGSSSPMTHIPNGGDAVPPAGGRGSAEPRNAATTGRRGARGRLSSLALDQGELLTIYIMLVVGCVLAGHDLIQNLFGIIAHADRYNTPERKYDVTFFQYLKPTSFLLVQDKDPGGADAIKAFYQGGANWADPRYLYPFLGPLTWWTIFLSVLIVMCLCISILIRRAWTENEKLAFPIVQLPLAMTNPSGRSLPFWRSKLMWSGFGVAAVIDFINGMHYLYPSWPYLAQVKLFDLAPYMTQRPWNAIGWTPISMYPFAIGLAYFLPLDLAFSCWFFYVARKIFQIVGAVQGWDSPSNLGFPFFEQQSSGAWIALGCVVVWGLRSQFRSAWQKCAWTGGAGRTGRTDGTGWTGSDGEERRQYRMAFMGLGAGVVFLAWFSWKTAMSSWVALIFFGLFFLLAVAMTRVRAELGAPHEIFFVNPRTVLVTLFGINTIGAQSLTTTSVLYWYNRCYRCHPMPNHIEAFKLAEGGRMQMGRLIALIAFATVIATICACWANLQVTFAEGATSKAVGYKSWVGFESFDRLNAWLQTPTKPTWTPQAYVVGGAVIVLALRMMRGAFLWWPFHPAGYALAVSFAMDYFWFAFFVSWLIKLVIVRFGGMKTHNGGVPFFLGLTLGDYVCGSLWAIYGPVNGLQVYKIFI